ncbi:hypothetical protein ASG92_24405 [Arthrobacter sp. Soil736]|nr:hypothetical protein ASG92_24405 [Arthrobacter sp. Soil736]
MDGRTVLVTGATGGIGGATAKGLAIGGEPTGFRSPNIRPWWDGLLLPSLYLHREPHWQPALTRCG